MKPKNKKQLLLEKIKTLVKDKTVAEELEQELFQADKISAQNSPDVVNQKSEPGISTLLNNLPGMAYRCLNDEHRTLLFVNSACFDLTGYQPGELVNNSKVSFAQLIHPGDREKVNAEVQSKTKCGKFFVIEYRLLHKNGNQTWVREKGRLAGKDKNGVGFIEGFVMDITEQVRMKEQLLESGKLLKNNEEIYRSLIENSNDAIYIIFNRRFETVNSGFEKMLGYNLEELKQMDFDPMDFIAPESRPYIEERITKLQKGEEVNPRYEFTAITKYGEKKEVETSVAYIPFKEGTATQGIIRDITERKQAEKKIKSLSEFRSLLVELSANFIYVLPEETDASVNKSLAKLGQFADVDRAYIFEYNFDKGIAKNTFEWCGDGVPPQINELQEVPLGYAPEWLKKHSSGKIMHIPDVSKIKKGKLQQMLQAQGIKSLLSIPLFNEDECTGFVGFDSVRKYF
ncbi:MAG: PAS domain S-box protein, partial [Prolixibacteraceae bacterium]